MRFTINQFPGPIMSSVFSSPSGIMLFDPASQVISVSNIKSGCLKAFKYINVIHKLDPKPNLRPSLRDALAKLSYSPKISKQEHTTKSRQMQAIID